MTCVVTSEGRIADANGRPRGPVPNVTRQTLALELMLDGESSAHIADLLGCHSGSVKVFAGIAAIRELARLAELGRWQISELSAPTGADQ